MLLAAAKGDYRYTAQYTNTPKQWRTIPHMIPVSASQIYIYNQNCLSQHLWFISYVYIVKRSDCILVYGSTTKGDVVKRSDCILVYGSTTKGDVVKRSDCIPVYGSTTKGDVV